MNKSLQYLLISFGVLFLLYLINESQQTKYKSSIESIFDVDENDIDKISLKDSNGDTLTLIKSDTLWSIFNHDSLVIKDRQIDQFWEKVIGGKYDMLISKNPSKWTKFGVADSSGKRLSLYKDNNQIVSVIFSNKGQDYSHNFYRTVGEDEVYRTSENIFYMLNTRPTYWGDKPKIESSDSTKVN